MGMIRQLTTYNVDVGDSIEINCGWIIPSEVGPGFLFYLGTRKSKSSLYPLNCGRYKPVNVN